MMKHRCLTCYKTGIQPLVFVPNFQEQLSEEELESETEDGSWDPFDFDDDFLAPDVIQPSEQAFETSLVNILRDVPHQNWLYESDERINVFHVTHVENAVSILGRADSVFTGRCSFTDV